MQGDVVCFVARDLVLRIICAGMVRIALVIHILGMHFHYRAADPAGFRVPAHVIANFECLVHGVVRDKYFSARLPVG
jgi:hypothetical protein